MVVALIIIAVILLIAILRIGIIIIYNDQGLALWLKIGFVKVKLDNDKRKERRKRRKEALNIKPGSLRELLDILKIFKEMLSRLRRKLLIKRLDLHYISAGSNPAATAIGFGAANALYGMIMPVLNRNFRIKKHDFKTSADFNAEEPMIYAKAVISMAVWEGIYILAALFPLLSSTSREDGERNGKRTDKQSIGNDNAENKGNDRG